MVAIDRNKWSRGIGPSGRDHRNAQAVENGVMGSFLKALGVIGLCATSAAGGFYLSKIGPQTNTFPLKPTASAKLGHVGAGTALACKAAGHASLATDSFKQVIQGQLDAGEDTISVKVDETGKFVFLLTVAAVEVGHTDSGRIPIIALNDNFIFAVITEDQATDAVVIDRSSRRVLWSRASVVLSKYLLGQTSFFDCW